MTGRQLAAAIAVTIAGMWLGLAGVFKGRQ